MSACRRLPVRRLESLGDSTMIVTFVRDFLRRGQRSGESKRNPGPSRGFHMRNPRLNVICPAAPNQLAAGARTAPWGIAWLVARAIRP